MQVQANGYERALWLLDRNKPLFERAVEIRYSDLHAGTGRLWTGFIGPRDRLPRLDDERLARCKQRIAASFHPYDGSGSSIAIEPFERGATSRGRHGGRRVFQLAIYLEGMPATSTEFQDGQLVRRGFRPARELVLTYAPETGAIDVVSVSAAGKELREAAAKAFVECCFDADGTLKPVRLRQVDLTGIMRPRPFATDPADGISSVRLLHARLAASDEFGRITLEIGSGSPITLHDAARRWFGGYDPFANGFTPNRVRLRVQFEPGHNERRNKAVQFDLTHPHGCTLRDRSERERLICEKYLQRWGLVKEV